MVFIKNVYVLNPVQPGDFEFYKGSILIRDGKVQRIFRGEDQSAPNVLEDGYEIEDYSFRYLVFPGFIQSHIHFCQTPHRNLAEEMPLMQWLKQEIWPFEGRHTPESIKRAALMSLKEVLSSGTTAVLDMGTVHHQDAIFELMAQTGFRYTGGKAMMDQCEDAPDSLAETTAQSIDQSIKLYESWHGKNKGLLHYAFAPRFVLSCSTQLLREVRRLSDKHNIIIHTHASEHPEEVASIKQSYGHGNIAYLDKLGALNRNTVIAHMVHLEPHEKHLVAEIKRNALSAAFHDHRFMPLGPDEFTRIKISVDVLTEPERIHSLDELDPCIYGLIISDGKLQRGVLLPSVPGIDTVEQQVEVVKRKAGLAGADDQLLEYYRFTSTRYH